jgi:uncharacterized protein YheU (UPF0270 family)
MVIEVPHTRIEPDTLRRIVEEFVLREGTDYGTEPVSLETKVRQVSAQLASGEAVVLFDSDLQSTHIAPAARRR